MMQRRSILVGAVRAAALLSLPACRSVARREDVLQGLVENVVVPNTLEVAVQSRNLQGAVASLAAAPNTAGLLASRTQWKQALLAWKRAYAFRNGPIVETNGLLRAIYWPPRPAAIDGLLSGSQPVDEASVETWGVDRRGLFALEYLLFSPGTSNETHAASFSGSNGERKARLIRGLADNVVRYGNAAAARMGDGKAFSVAFAQGGQGSVNKLVGQMSDTVENVVAARLTRVSGFAKSGLLKPAEVEGSSSQMSQQVALAYLEATERLYVGSEKGLGDLVKASSPTFDALLRASFTQAIDSVRRLAAPLEEVAKRDLASLDAAAASVKRLELAIRTELASALGVTLTFSSGDGD